MTADLIARCDDWLQAYDVTHVALKARGYWKPIYYVLEDAFQLLLIDLLELKHVPCRKIDVKGSEWLAQSLERGLLQRELCAAAADPRAARLTRYQDQQVRDRSREVIDLQGPGATPGSN